MTAGPLPEDLESLPRPGRTRHTVTVPGDDPVELAVTVIRGARPGPRLALIGGVHGDEFEGPRALMHVSNSLRPSALHGTLVIAPVVNVPAFEGCSRLSPVDGLNLNRVFPGRAGGSITERIANAVIERLVRGSDAVFSMHGATANGILAPWVEFQQVEDATGLASYRMALASGVPNLFPLPYGYDPGLLLFACHDLGIPCIEGERGGNGVLTPGQWLAYAESAKRVMAHLGMLWRAFPRFVPPEVCDHVAVTAPAKGFWERAVLPGQAVDADEPLGTLYDLAGTAIDSPAAPYAGRVMSVRTRPPVEAGDRLAAIGLPIELPAFFEA